MIKKKVKVVYVVTYNGQPVAIFKTRDSARAYIKEYPADRLCVREMEITK